MSKRRPSQQRLCEVLLSPAGADLQEWSTRLRRAFLEFGSDTPDNAGAVALLSYETSRAESGIDVTGIHIAGERLAEIVYKLEFFFDAHAGTFASMGISEEALGGALRILALISYAIEIPASDEAGV